MPKKERLKMASVPADSNFAAALLNENIGQSHPSGNYRSISYSWRLVSATVRKHVRKRATTLATYAGHGIPGHLESTSTSQALCERPAAADINDVTGHF